jgi:protein involved in polysaccharide export with SLBB domain
MRIAVGLLGMLLLVSGSGLQAQSRSGEAARGQLTRLELEELLGRYGAMAESPAYSGAVRNEARQESALIRQRLEEGDLRVGDRIMLHVEGHEALSDTFTVVSGRRVILPELGEVALSGVLRSELETHLRSHIAGFIREPIVHARALIRLQILGAVTRPGFYTVPSDYLLSDALMMAGGPTANANLERLRVERGNEIIWDGARLREAVVEGRTLDQLSVRAGDGIHLPEQRSRFDTVRNVATLITTLAAVLVLVTR